MATNERNVDRMVEVIDNASRHARMVYYLYLGFIAYCAVTVFSTTDKQLALKGDKAELPILDISVPLDGFFLLAPILAIGLFVYFMLYLHRLNSLIDDLSEADPSYNKKDLYPWMINIARETEKGTIGFLQRLVVGLTLWFTLPVTMFIFASKFVKKHEDFLSYLIVALAFASIFIVFWFWNKLGKRNYDELIRYTILPFIIYFAVLVAVFLPKINEGNFKWANLNLRNEVLVKIPDIGEKVEQGYWADLEGVNLNGADLTNAVLKRANLRKAQLKRTNLYRTNLEKADLSNANLQKARLLNADLQEANLNWANLQKALLNGANLQKALLNGANLQEAYLNSANLQEAYLEQANLQKADLEQANLQEAKLWEARLQEADLNNANLQEAVFDRANLQEADLRYANLQRAYLEQANLQEAKLEGANLQGVRTLTKEQLCEAITLYVTEIEEDLLNAIISDKDCAYKLTEESYDKWREKLGQIE